MGNLERWYNWGRWVFTALIIVVSILIIAWLSIKYTKSSSITSSSSGINTISYGSGVNKAAVTTAISGGTAKSSASSLLKDAQYGMLGYQAYRGGKYAYSYMYGKNPAAAEEASADAATAEATAAADGVTSASVDAAVTTSATTVSADAAATESAISAGTETTADAAAAAEDTVETSPEIAELLDMFPELADFGPEIMALGEEFIAFIPELMEFLPLLLL